METAHASLAAALAAAQRRAEAVEKDATNPFHKYKYASAEAIIAEARQALAIEGLAVFPLSVERDPDQRDHVWEKGMYFDKERGKEVEDTWIVIPRRIKVTYRLLHESGQTLDFWSTTPVIPEKGRPEDKAEFGARTENLGYTLRDLLLLPRVNEETASAAPSARDDRGYQNQAPASQPQRQQPSAQPPRTQQQPPKGETAPKASAAPAAAGPSTEMQATTAGTAAARTTTTPGSTAGPQETPEPANDGPRLVRDEPLTPDQHKVIGGLFKQLVPKVSSPMASKIVQDVTGKATESLTVEDGVKLKAYLEERISKQGVAS